ncbi:MAG TPA: type II CAAX endopeptidase family protein [Thermoanaerobaculia bacterium]
MRFLDFADRVLSPVLLFVAVYLSALIPLAWVGFPLVQWAALISVTIATVVTIVWVEKGRWDLGLFTTPFVALRDFVSGSVVGIVLVGLCALLVVLSTDLSHERGTGFPWVELVTIFIPAALHEELLFRGYPFQKILRWNRAAAILLVAAVFSALHGGNEAVSWIGLTNIFLGGVLLGLAYEMHYRLWFPIGIHLAWNLMTGPILGHEVSGYAGMQTLFVETGGGPTFLTGGDFGIEGSIWMTLAELIGIVFLMTRRSRRGQASVVGEGGRS